MLLAATVFIVLEFLGQTILEAKDINHRSVNTDLETVLSFKKNIKKHVTNKKNIVIPKKYTNNGHAEKKSSLEYKVKVDYKDDSESNDHTIGKAVNPDYETEYFSNVDGSDDDITTKKYHTKYKHTPPFYMEQTSKEYKLYKIRETTNSNIGRSYNEQKDVILESFSTDLSRINKRKHHRKHKTKSTTEINTDKSNNYKYKKQNENHNSKLFGLEINKKKEKYVPKTRDVNGRKGEKYKFSMHSYLKTVYFDGNELRLKLSESGSDEDDKEVLRMHKSMPQKIENPQVKIVQKPQTTKNFYTMTQKKVSVTPLCEESSDDNSEESKEFKKGTKEPVVEKRHEPITDDDQSSSKQENFNQNFIPQTTKNLNIRNDKDKRSEAFEDQSISNEIKNKRIVQVFSKSKINEGSSNLKSVGQSSENDESLGISKSNKHDDISHDEENSMDYNEQRKEHTKTTSKPIKEKAMKIITEDTTTSSKSEEEKSLNEETYMYSIKKQRGQAKRFKHTGLISQTTTNLYTTKEPINVNEESYGEDSDELSRESKDNVKIVTLQKTYETKSTNKNYQPVLFELMEETKSKNEVLKHGYIDNVIESNTYSVNDVTTKAIEIKTKKEPVQKQTSEDASSIEKQLFAENESPAYYVERINNQEINVETTKREKSYEYSKEEKDHLQQEKKVAPPNQFETQMDLIFLQDWVKESEAEQALRNQQLQTNIEKYRFRKQNKKINSPIPVIKKTNLFNYGPMTKENIKNKMMEVMRQRYEMLNEYNDPHMPLNLMRNYGAQKKSFELDDMQNANAYAEQETIRSNLNKKVLDKIQKYRSRKRNTGINTPVLETQTNKIFDVENVSKEKDFIRRPIDTKENSMIQQEQQKIRDLDETKIEDEVIQTGKRDIRRTEYHYGSSSELFKNLSAMKKHLDDNYSTFNQNHYISTELKKSTNTQFKPFESKMKKNFDFLERYKVLKKKSTLTKGEHVTQENKNHIPKFYNAIPNFQETHKKVDNISPGQQKPIRINKRNTEKTAHSRIEVTLTTEPIDSLINKINLSNYLEKKQSRILDTKAFDANTTENNKITNISLRRMLTHNVTENKNTSLNTDLNKSTRSYIVLSDLIKFYPVKIDLDTLTNEIVNLNKTQNKNQDFQRRKMGNRAKIKQLQHMYKTMYPMETTKPEMISTTTINPKIGVTTIKPSTTAEAIVTSTDTHLVTIKKELGTTSRTPIKSTRKKRRRKKRRRRTSTSEPSTVTTELIISTTEENTKRTIEHTSTIAKEISIVPYLKVSTHKDIAITTTPSTVNTQNTKELLNTRSASVITSNSTDIDFEPMPTSIGTFPTPTQRLLEPIISTGYNKTTIKPTIDTTEYRKTMDYKKVNAPTEYRKSNTIDGDVNIPSQESKLQLHPQDEVDDYQQLLQNISNDDNNTNITDVTDNDYYAILFKNDTNREHIEMIEKLNLQPMNANETDFGLKDAIALADAVKPEHNLETELRMEKARLLLNKDMMKLYGHTYSANTFPSTVPSNTLYTDPFDPVMAGGIDLGLGFI